MNDRPAAHAAKRLQGQNQSDTRRSGRRLLYYASSIVSGVICGFLLGNSWSRQPVVLTYDATVPASSADTPGTSPDAPTPDITPVADILSGKKGNVSSDTDKEPAVILMREPVAVQKPPVVPEPPAMQDREAVQESPVRQEPVAVQESPAVQEPVAVRESPVRQEPVAVRKFAPAPPPPSKPFYIVQVGAFSKVDNATRAVSQLQTKGFEADMVHPGNRDQRALYRVYIARFHDEISAKAAAVAFRTKENRKAYVVRYQPPPSSVSSGQR